MSNQITFKHRASAPVQATERPEVSGTHRGSRASDLPVAALLGLILLVLAGYLAVRH